MTRYIFLLLTISLMFGADAPKPAPKPQPRVKKPRPNLQPRNGEIYCGNALEDRKTPPCQCQRRLAAMQRTHMDGCQRLADPDESFKCMALAPSCSDAPAMDHTDDAPSRDEMGPLCKRYCNKSNCACCKS